MDSSFYFTCLGTIPARLRVYKSAEIIIAETLPWHSRSYPSHRNTGPACQSTLNCLPASNALWSEGLAKAKQEHKNDTKPSLSHSRPWGQILTSPYCCIRFSIASLSVGQAVMELCSEAGALEETGLPSFRWNCSATRIKILRVLHHL